MATCEACRYFFVADEGDAVFCRRYPPVVLPVAGKTTALAGVRMALPIVTAADWCGEHRERDVWQEPAHARV